MKMWRALKRQAPADFEGYQYLGDVELPGARCRIVLNAVALDLCRGLRP